VVWIRFRAARVGQHSHLVAAIHELAGEGKLWLRVATEGDERLEDPHGKI
jgi:quercetin dioxygenase-like cupin family protein